MKIGMRKLFYLISIIVLIIWGVLIFFDVHFLWLGLLIVPILWMGISDILQKKHAIKSNFPVLGRLRYFMEVMRPKIYQYFIESDTNGTPFNRLQRSVVYQRSKNETDTQPFGTQLDVYDPGYEFVNHSMKAVHFDQLEENPRIKIGSSQCTKPYMASMFNISAMSFGSLSKTAILALNEGAKLGGFYHNTGEGGLSPYHLQMGGDVVWNIGTGYFSCRTPEGKFSEVEFEKRATLPNVKMIEIKFSQGAKPGHGGILPKAKVTDEIAAIRLVSKGQDILSPPTHSAFSTPRELMQFVRLLREKSGGKPIGIKLCVGRKYEFISLCKAMIEEKTYLDFITVDGGEGGTGAAPPEFSDHVGMPLRDALAFVYDTLKGYDLKNQIKIIASGKVISGFDIVRALSIGADVCNSARGMMFALGCIQALECNKNTCPTGIATQNPDLYKGLDVDSKSQRVNRYHRETIKNALELIAASGLSHPDEVDRWVVCRRIDANKIETLRETYPELKAGCLLDDETIPEKWKRDCKKATADKF
jgi:glutamate synthase domain-containing protein 2